MNRMAEFRPRLVVDADPAAAVAARFEARLDAFPASTLGLATGRTPRGVYAGLVAAFAAGRVSFAAATSFNLDEYVGLAAAHPASFASYMREQLFSKVDLGAARAHVPRGDAADPNAEARRYERAIEAAGGIDLLLLGIGGNGHIGFNEPGSDIASRTRVVELSAATREANARDFPAGETPPERAITMGIATILEAREIVLLATGAAKAEAVAAALAGPLTEACPASALRLHPRVTFICDAAAAGGLGDGRVATQC